MLPFWFLLKVLGLFRVPANEETVGLDASYHGGTAYPGHGADDFLDKSTSRHGNKEGKINGDDAMDGNGVNGGGNGGTDVGFPLLLLSPPLSLTLFLGLLPSNL